MSYYPPNKKIVARQETGWFSLHTAFIALFLLVGAAVLIVSIVTLVKVNDGGMTPLLDGENLLCLNDIANLENPTEEDFAGCPMANLLKKLRNDNAPDNNNGDENSLKALVEKIIADGLVAYKKTEEYQQWVELGLTKCRDDIGASHLYNFTTYKRLELSAIIAFDVAGQVPSSVFFFPNITGVFPAVTGSAPPSLGDVPAYGTVNTLDSEVFVKDVSITTALGFTLNISMLDIDFARDDRITLFLKNLRDRGYLIDSNGIRKNNLEKRRYMAGLSMKVQMNRFLPKIDLLVEQVYGDVTMYKKSVLGSYDERLLTFFLSTHVGDRHYPKFVRSFFKNFSYIVSSWLPNEPNRNESILYNNANADCVIQFFRDCASDIMKTGDTTTLMYYWQAAGMSPETTVTEAMHNWIAYRQFMHITDLVVEHSLNPLPRGFPSGQPSLSGNWTFSTGGASMFQKWAGLTTETQKISTWREMMRVLLPNNAWFSRKPNGTLSARESYQRAIHLPALIQGRAITISAAGNPLLGPGVFRPARYDGFAATLSEFINQSLTVDKRTDYILFNHSDTPAYLQEEMRKMGVSAVDGETIFHHGEEKMFPVFAQPEYAAFGLGWRACAGQNMVTIYGVRFMDRFFRLKFYKNTSITVATGPMIPQAPLKSVPDNLFVNQTELKNMIN